MVSKIMKYLIPMIMILLIIGIVLQYYISINTQPDSMICHKGKLLMQLQEGEAIYTRATGVVCEFEKGMLIIEETK
jgi:preprotein translocase subunit YajC